MPTYQYACTQCGHRLEAVQSFSDGPLTVCPECEGKLRKVFSAVGVVFKGSGFYRTDSRAAAGATNGKSGTKPAETTTGSGSKTSESSSGTAASSSNGSSSSSNGSSSSSSNGSSSGSSAASGTPAAASA